MSDPINPPHYKANAAGVECIVVVENLNFNLGNGIKYLWRAGLKGDPVEDLDKALWYLRREAARPMAQTLFDLVAAGPRLAALGLDVPAVAAGLPKPSRPVFLVLWLAVTQASIDRLAEAIEHLEGVIAFERRHREQGMMKSYARGDFL